MDVPIFKVSGAPSFAPADREHRHARHGGAPHPEENLCEVSTEGLAGPFRGEPRHDDEVKEGQCEGVPRHWVAPLLVHLPDAQRMPFRYNASHAMALSDHARLAFLSKRHFHESGIQSA